MNENQMNQSMNMNMPNMTNKPDKPNKTNKAKYLLIGMIIGILSAVIVVGTIAIAYDVRDVYAYPPSSQAESGIPGSVTEASPAGKLQTLKDTISKYYYDYNNNGVTEAMLDDGSYHGLLDALGDPYSTYYSEDELESSFQSTEGIFYGIGVRMQIDVDYGYARVIEVMKGGPALEVGVHIDDLIYRVDGTDTHGMNVNEVADIVRGPEGTTVHIDFLRGEDVVSYDIERRKVETSTVFAEHCDDGIEYIEITEFDQVTPGQFSDALKEAQANQMKGLLIDLRGNPGGTVSSVVDIASEFLPQGKTVLYSVDKNGYTDYYYSSGDGWMDVPVVVLVDHNSASAAEILTGVFKDYNIGTVVGTQTYGKGIVQRIIDLGDGTAVKLTFASYYTPKGVCIQGVGIAPDIECDFDADAYYDETDPVDNQKEKAMEVLRDLIADKN